MDGVGEVIDLPSIPSRCISVRLNESFDAFDDGDDESVIEVGE